MSKGIISNFFDDQNKIQSERLAKKQEKIEIIQIFSANFEEENQINQMDLLNKNKWDII